MLRSVVLSIFFATCLAGDENNIGGENYIPCRYCHVPKDQFPDEG